MSRNGEILICAAVEDEIRPLISGFESIDESMIGGKMTVSGKMAGKKVRAVVTGPGLVNSAHAITCAIESCSPSLLIQTGCAGAFPRSGLGVGDLGLASEEIDAHLGLELADRTDIGASSGSLKIRDLPFALFVKNGAAYKNRYPLDPGLVGRACEIISKSRISSRPGEESQSPQIKTGPFLTVSTITATDDRAEKLYALYRPCMESMEGSAAAHLCIQYELPFLEIRGAANLVGNRDRLAWNIPLACERACEAVCRIVAGIDF